MASPSASRRARGPCRVRAPSHPGVQGGPDQRDHGQHAHHHRGEAGRHVRPGGHRARHARDGRRAAGQRQRRGADDARTPRPTRGRAGPGSRRGGSQHRDAHFDVRAMAARVRHAEREARAVGDAGRHRERERVAFGGGASAVAGVARRAPRTRRGRRSGRRRARSGTSSGTCVPGVRLARRQRARAPPAALPSTVSPKPARMRLIGPRIDGKSMATSSASERPQLALELGRALGGRPGLVDAPVSGHMTETRAARGARIPYDRSRIAHGCQGNRGSRTDRQNHAEGMSAVRRVHAAQPARGDPAHPGHVAGAEDSRSASGSAPSATTSRKRTARPTRRLGRRDDKRGPRPLGSNTGRRAR